MFDDYLDALWDMVANEPSIELLDELLVELENFQDNLKRLIQNLKGP